MQFELYDAVSAGAQIGATLTRDDMTITDEVFTVTLDFGADSLNGSNRFLEIGVRPGSSTGVYTVLSPRQPVTPTPYAIRSLAATAADGLSAACVNCVTSSQIQTVQGAQVSGEIPVASVLTSSANYIQNTTTQQAGANFNISGIVETWLRHWRAYAVSAR